MLQLPNEQSAEPCEPVKCLSSIPLDKCCLVVQMPSIEEMKREVADITCKMQSVYIDPKMDDHHQELPDGSGATLPIEDRGTSGSCEHRNFEYSESNKIMDDQCSSNQLERLKSYTFGSNPNTNLIGDKDDDYLVPTSPVKTSTSTLPREEQVFEEFVINGKRYRQVYQRRVVLERRTTRDVFFLPANNTDSDVNPSNFRCLEYTSPEYNEDKSNLSGDLSMDTTDNRVRPGLDLTVLHPSNGGTNDENGIAPAVIMRAVTDLCRSPKSNSLDRPSAVSKSPSVPQNSNQMIAQTEVKNSEKCSSDEQSNHKTDYFKRKKFMKSFTNAIRKHIQCGIRRTKSHAKSEGLISTKTLPENAVKEKWNMNKDVGITSKVSCSTDEVKEYSDDGSKEIVGYMYKFGVWDDQEPVLDPRLPRALKSSKQNSTDLDGTVIPTPPEWHHAEVGLEHTKSPNSPFIRGRTVACLQRFTQHSSASGKPLHRSTYVQQTRLVRQRNRETSTKGEDSQKSEGSRSSLTTQSGLDTAKTDISDPNDSNLTSNDKESGWQLNASDFKKCSNDRLQLLQSLCPSAAAAAILLGKQIQTPSSLGSDSEETFEKLTMMDDLGETSVMVTAKTWCPTSLLVKDLSPYLVFNNLHGESNSPTSFANPGLKASPASTGLPEMSIRGGTLDALLIHTIHLLQMPSSDYPDCLLPDVLRVTYPIFTTPDKIIQRLIQFYIAYAPIEPGCQSSDWLDALTAVDYLITIVQRLQTEQLSASLVLRLARFVRLLQLDGQAATSTPTSNDVPLEHDQDSYKTLHVELADRLSSKLPVLSSTTRLRFNSSDYGIKLNDTKQNLFCEDHIISNIKGDIDLVCTSGEMADLNNPLKSMVVGSTYDELEPAIQRIQQFVTSDPLSIAEELTRLEEEKFMQINFLELLNIPQLERGEAASLGICVEHFNKITKWARSLLFVFSPKLAQYEESLNKPGQDKSLKKQAQNSSTISPKLDKRPKRSISHSRNPTEKENSLIVANQNSNEATMNGQDKSFNKDDGFSRQKSCYIRLPTVVSNCKTLPVREVAAINSMFIHMCEILKYLKQLNNFSSFLALLLAIQEVPDSILSKKSKNLLAVFSAYMKPPNFAEYRRDLEAADLPCLPYLGLIFQQLIHLHAGNPIYLPDLIENLSKYDNGMENNGSGGSALTGAMTISTVYPDKLINMWRCWKHYLILGYFIKREESSPKSRHNINMNEKINQILNNFQDCFPDNVLDQAKENLVSRVRAKRSFRS